MDISTNGGAHVVAPDTFSLLNPAEARALVRERLRALGLSDLIDDGELIVSELVGNAVLHGYGCTGVQVLEVEGGPASRWRTARRPRRWWGWDRGTP